MVCMLCSVSDSWSVDGWGQVGWSLNTKKMVGLMRSVLSMFSIALAIVGVFHFFYVFHGLVCNIHITVLQFV